MKKARFLRPAEIELLDAARYYEIQAPGLGIDFLDKIAAAVEDIRAHPKRWLVIQFNIRRRLIQRFPYCILYRIDSDEIVILAIMHLHRHPSYWIDRL